MIPFYYASFVNLKSCNVRLLVVGEVVAYALIHVFIIASVGNSFLKYYSLIIPMNNVLNLYEKGINKFTTCKFVRFIL